MRERTIAIGRLIALVLATAAVFVDNPIQGAVKQSLNADVVSTVHVSTPAPSQAIQASVQQIQVTKPIEQPKQPWTVTSSPNGGVDHVNNALALYQSMGLTKQGASMLIGNFLQEMPLAFATGNPCGVFGDGGLAEGIGQWHPGRRHDMPCGFSEQLTWAVTVEMQRDGGGKKLYPLLFDTAATTEQLDWGIGQWERYGHKGNRYEYGASLLSQL